MIINNVQDNGDAVLVAGINEFLQFVLGTVIFIRGKIEIRIVSPAFIAIEFINGHQFNGVDTCVL